MLFIPSGFVEHTQGADLLWFIGDNFVATSYRNHFKKYNPERDEDKHFIKRNYKFTAFCNSRFASSQSNILARLQNSFAMAVNSNKKSGLMAKYIIVVLDDDLVTYLGATDDQSNLATLFGSWIEWLAKSFTDLINQQMNQLPDKSKKYYPFIYWVLAPTHSFFDKNANQQRIKFNLSLESVIRAKDNDHIRVIKLKDGWNTKDSTLVINNRFSERGLTVFWTAVDRSFWYNSMRCEVFLARQLAYPETGDPKPNASRASETEKSNSARHPEGHHSAGCSTDRPGHGYVSNHILEEEDPMQSFFRRRVFYDNNAGFHRGIHEDQCRFGAEERPDRCYDRFYLPHLRR